MKKIRFDEAGLSLYGATYGFFSGWATVEGGIVTEIEIEPQALRRHELRLRANANDPFLAKMFQALADYIESAFYDEIWEPEGVYVESGNSWWKP